MFSQGTRIEDDRTVDLLCREWRQVGLRNLDGPYTDVQPGKGDTLQFDLSGTYQRRFRGLVVNGSWKLSEDSTMLFIAISSLGKLMLPNAIPLDKVKPTKTILVLTRDSLVLSSEEYIDLRGNMARVANYYVPIHN